ncbi:tandem-type lipoprotein [Staphylococcus aureus]|uniref:tandem-type lipoprotein n=1 Tax=Staphylococcus aureus TaxID=1280 RepID=UPI0007C4C643|nr:tandem-type lipoprotein [Staphylococcus aureus]MBZ5244281.1 tandem-type lipoprotein [Staphylococcus aureus]MBZ5287180.1 tandem-type lipoprotein [Staphylococcus aureus]MBZ5289959.1 tandem-type lipoprotein [Staphylococcus aureus]QSU80169.1 tandem-type lipoprotein [Staphylococcus aureus]QSU85315.1 tandem-type lipoprotein [Staphylococcus aureus]
MKSIKRIGLCISLLILIIFVTSCDGDNKIIGDSKEEQIKKSFAKTLDIYPIKNLEDLYDKEGYRDGEFKKDDKGTWLIRSEMKIQLKGENLESRGAVLEINRNTRTAKGHYIVREVVEDSDGMTHNHTKRYPVKMENNKMIPLKPIDDEKAPKLLLKGSGNLKGSSVGYKNIEFTFIENKEENIYFTDSIYFNPSEDK